MSEHQDLPASAWIGVVERFGFTFAMMLGYPEVAALLIAVKALGQYAPSNSGGNNGAAARVIGTLTSLTWAIAMFAIFQFATS